MSRHQLPLLGSLLLFLLAAGMGLTAFQVVTTATPPPGVSAGAAEGADPQSTPPPALQDTTRPVRPESYYAAITNRPLFAQTRRPVAPQAEAPDLEPTRAPEPEPSPEPTPAQMAPPPPQPRLLGVMQAGSEAKALLSDPSGEMSWVTSGTTFSGWKINKITPEWIEIRHHEQTLRVELYRQ